MPWKRGGHTPGHTVYQLRLSEAQQAVFVGDILHAVALQFPHPSFCARYDSDPKAAVESRLKTLRQAGILLGAHFPFPGIAEATPAGASKDSFEYVEYVPQQASPEEPAEK